ncbi:MAG: thiopurine S-methyltransferase [Pseudomonadota bacterium]
MQAEFWHERWRENKIGFHEAAPNEFLVRHFEAMGLEPGSRIFVPLAGKSLDLSWLEAQGMRVVGVELDESAVRAFFDEAETTTLVSSVGSLQKYRSGDVELLAGDIFDLTPEILGPVDAIYDRAALVALPDEMRARYAKHVVSLTGAAPQLLVAFDYDQTQTAGPPFSVNQTMIEALYRATYSQTLLSRQPITGRLAQRCGGFEESWLLVPKAL